MRYRLEASGGTAIAVDRGRLVDPDGRFPFSIQVGSGELRPGLINAHDHLHRNHFPRLGRPPYPDAYAWGTDLHERFADEIARARTLDGRAALLFGALKNLLGGATTVVHHDPWSDVLGKDFPVRLAPVRAVHSLRFERDFPAAVAGRPGGADRPLCIHLAEGTNPEAAEEVRTLARLGLVDRRLLAVHAVGVDADGVDRLRAAGAAVVWCPTSNEFLFGRTAPAELLAGVDVLLGTDSLLTGEGTLLEELRAAHAASLLDPARLIDAVGRTAAWRLGLPEPRLEPGAPADVVLLRRPLLEAGTEHVALVIVDGVPRLADECLSELFERLGLETEPLEVGGARKVVATPLATVAEQVVDLSPECGRIFRRDAVRFGAIAGCAR